MGNSEWLGHSNYSVRDLTNIIVFSGRAQGSGLNGAPNFGFLLREATLTLPSSPCPSQIGFSRRASYWWPVEAPGLDSGATSEEGAAVSGGVGG